MAYEYGPPSRSIKETLMAIREGLMCEYRAGYLPAHRRSPRRARRLRQIRGWSREAGRLVAQIDRVMLETLPRIERDAGYTFRDPDGLLRILMDDSTKRLFFGILAGFPEDALPLPAIDLDMLGKFPDDARALALIGDVTLRLKVLPALQVENRPSLADPSAGAAGLATLCDRWGLHESRIGLACRRHPTGETLTREKETLAGAVLGLIYVEGGTDALRAAVPLLACGR